MRYTFTLLSGSVLTSTFENGVLTDTMEKEGEPTDTLVFTDTGEILLYFMQQAMNYIDAMLTTGMPEANMIGYMGLLRFQDQVAELLIPLDDIPPSLHHLADNTFGTVTMRGYEA